MIQDPSDASRPSGRLQYEPPKILDTAEFETLALACAKQPGETDPQSCYFGPYPTSAS